MEALIGISGPDYVILAADRNAARSIVVMKSDQDKSRNLSDNVALCFSGEPGDAPNFAEYVQSNVRLYELRNQIALTPHAAAHYTRRLLADALRSRTPYTTNVLVGGCDGEGSRLYWIDYLATLTELPFAAHGYASYFVLSLMDRHYRKDMTVEEGLGLLKMCLQELKTRFIVNLPTFSVKIIRPTGIENMVISA